MEQCFHETDKRLIELYCSYIGCRPPTAVPYVFDIQSRLSVCIQQSTVAKTLQSVQSLLTFDTFDVPLYGCLLGYIGFNDFMFRDLLQHPHKQRKLLWCSILILFKNILFVPVDIFQIINYITTIAACLYWVCIKPWTPSLLHLYMIRMLVLLHILQVVVSDFYHGFWENGKVGFQVALSVRTHVFQSITPSNRHHMKAWADMYTIWHSASACGNGRGSSDLPRSLFSSMSPLLIAIEDVQHHEFARIFQLLYRYMLLFDQSDFMAFETNLVPLESVFQWGTLNQTACSVLQPSYSQDIHEMIYTTA